MILTGSAIEESIANGDITLYPFDKNLLNPNSYNYRLGAELKVYTRWDGNKAIFESLILGKEGYVLSPHQMYLAHTLEVIGSRKFAMSLIGRSSIGRMGLFLQLSANIGHTGSEHSWTLELMATLPIRIYPGMKIGQVSFGKTWAKHVR